MVIPVMHLRIHPQPAFVNVDARFRDFLSAVSRDRSRMCAVSRDRETPNYGNPCYGDPKKSGPFEDHQRNGDLQEIWGSPLSLTVTRTGASLRPPTSAFSAPHNQDPPCPMRCIYNKDDYTGFAPFKRKVLLMPHKLPHFCDSALPYLNIKVNLSWKLEIAPFAVVSSDI